MRKVIIGIVSKHYCKDFYEFRDTFIRDELKQAIFDNNAIAIGILPSCFEKVKAINDWKDSLTEKEKEDINFQISLCDGIILQGGGFSDEYECYIAKYCYDNDIPILGICAGNNNLVRAVGGKILRLDEPEKHKSMDKYVHEINIDKQSMFYKIIGKEKVMVNSRHKCYTANSSILDDVAFSPDGIVEAVEDKSKKFYLAVQFHPESLYKIDENMNNIFKKFIEKGNIKNQIADMMIEKEENSKISLEKTIYNCNSVKATAKVMKEAPVLILVLKDYEDNWLTGDLLSIGGAIEHICLRATDLGLGSLWIRDIVYTKKEIAKLNMDGLMRMDKDIMV